MTVPVYALTTGIAKGKAKPRAPDLASQGTSNNGKSAYELATTPSKQFELYYRSQSIVDDNEWADFVATCQATLPTTFRITSSRAASEAINEHVERVFVPHLSNVTFEGIKQCPPKPLMWYPGHLAWQLDTAKQVIRKSREFAKSIEAAFSI